MVRVWRFIPIGLCWSILPRRIRVARLPPSPIRPQRARIVRFRGILGTTGTDVIFKVVRPTRQSLTGRPALLTLR